MLAEVLEVFEEVDDGLIVDATIGGAGHARALLQQAPTRQLLGIDRDPSAVKVSRDRLAEFGRRAQVVHGRFDQIDQILDLDGRQLTGALFDLGVSSHQLDTPDRGFSHRYAAPLDMTVVDQRVKDDVPEQNKQCRDPKKSCCTYESIP